MSRKLFLLLIVVVASATFTVLAGAEKDKEDDFKGGDLYRCTVLEDAAGVYYYDEKVFDTCTKIVDGADK